MYIRTDFHIYKIKSEEIIQGEKYYNIEIRGGLNKLKAEFGKQADTIEELCDCFIIEWLPSNHKDIFSIDEYSKEVVKSCIGNNKTNVYGAIWVDGKGLIYVAKMNEKGELELI